MLKLISNKIRCKFCGDVIESRSVHDFRSCKCGKCSTDGGLEYAKRSFITNNPEDTYEDLSTYVDENGKIIEAKDVGKKDIPLEPIRVEIKEVEVPEEPSAPILDIPKVTEAAEAEPAPVSVLKAETNAYDEEVVIKRDKNGKPISGRYPYGKKD